MFRVEVAITSLPTEEGARERESSQEKWKMMMPDSTQTRGTFLGAPAPAVQCCARINLKIADDFHFCETWICETSIHYTKICWIPVEMNMKIIPQETYSTETDPSELQSESVEIIYQKFDYFSQPRKILLNRDIFTFYLLLHANNKWKSLSKNQQISI